MFRRPLGEAASGRPLHLHGRRIQILHVEDDGHMATMYRLGLEMAGFSVASARDADRAVQTLEHGQRFDLVLLDIQLPGTSGLDLLLMLKTMRATQSVPAVVLTNLDDPDLQQLATRRGASGFLLKVNTDPRRLVNYLVELVEPSA